MARYTFVLINKNTNLAAWWLKIKSLPELYDYLAATQSRYSRAFQNFDQDKFYQPNLMTHGPHIREANLTLAAYLHGLNHNLSIVDAICDIAGTVAQNMTDMLLQNGHLYINQNGGYNACNPEYQDVCFRDTLTWPEFTEQDIHISKFPGGTHYYARIGQVDVKSGDKIKFDDYKSARQAAMAYIQTR